MTTSSKLLLFFVSLLLLASLVACSGGGSNGNANPGATTFTVSVCSLGCSGGGTCAVNEIATNQEISFSFNDSIDRDTVHFGTISITERLSGSTPPGSFIIDGRKVSFRPALVEGENGISFGFNDGKDYEIKLLASPESSVVRSRIGRPNTTPLSCVVRTQGVIDLVPGRPIVNTNPDQQNPPTGRSFDIVMTFNDLVQKAQLVDEFGGSPTIEVKLVDITQGTPLEIPVDGTFSAVLDQQSLQTVVTFESLGTYPGNAELGGTPRRWIEVTFASQIADLANNSLANPGAKIIPLPVSVPTQGGFAEDFQDDSQEDEDGSTATLWAGNGTGLDSGIEAATGNHKGGGPGVLGRFEPSSNVEFDTDSMVISRDDTLINKNVTVTGGAFFFEEVVIPIGVQITATGKNPLRIYSRGQLVIQGDLDLSGESADVAVNKIWTGSPAHPGKWRPGGERQPPEPNMPEFPNSFGGLSGQGELTGGDGGEGGDTWYSIKGNPQYYDIGKRNWLSSDPDPTRFTHFINDDRVHGRSGDGVGGRNSRGSPIDDAGRIAADWANGAGMGSWAWPPISDGVFRNPGSFSNPVLFESHRLPNNIFDKHAIHRARGGGGGGFWTPGENGIHFFAAARNAKNEALSPNLVPEIDLPNDVQEFNNFYDFNELAGGGVEDGAGGDYQVGPVGFHTLDPALDFLLGGSGGGGGGCSMHGSWNDLPSAVRGDIDTYRTSSGAGGGAGGGACQLQVGGRFAVSGNLTVRGGDGGSSRFMVSLPGVNIIDFGAPGIAGGGGGSGGSLLLQICGDMQVRTDGINAEGGIGGEGDVGNFGGDGGSGIVRFETRTGSETLGDLESIVTPDAAVELGPIGQAGQPNVVPLSTQVTDVLPIDGVFSANASGVRSLWYEPDPAIVFLQYEGYTLDVEYSTDGVTPQTLQYVVMADANPAGPIPGTDPIWVAFQTGWGLPPGQGQPSFPEPSSLSKWIIPGYGSLLTGSDVTTRMNSRVSRLLRFQLVFDQDQVAQLIGTNPAAYFKVTRFEINWNGE